jgi:PAS domain S-box-containing protein
MGAYKSLYPHEPTIHQCPTYSLIRPALLPAPKTEPLVAPACLYFAPHGERSFGRSCRTDMNAWLPCGCTFSFMTRVSFEKSERPIEDRVREFMKNLPTDSIEREYAASQLLEELTITIEELKAAERELRRQNEELSTTRTALEIERRKYRDLFENAPDGYVVTDRLGTIAEANLMVGEMLRVHPESLVGRPMAIFINAPASQPIEALLRELDEGKKVAGWEVSLRSVEGETLPALINITPIPATDESAEGLRWIIRDIAVRKRALEALRENEERFRRAIEDAPIPIIMHAEDGEVLQISRTWTELTGYTLQDVPTFDAWLTRAYGEGADAVRDHMQALFKEDKRTIGIEFPIRTRDGRIRYWSFSASSPGTLVDGRRFIIGMAVDITERKRAGAERERLLALVQAQAQKIEAVFGTIVEAVVVYDLQGRPTRANAEAARIFGFDPLGNYQGVRTGRESLKYPDGRTVAGEDLPLVRALAGRTVRGERYRYTNGEGREFVIDASVAPMYEGGSLRGAVGIWHDVTRHEQMAQKLRESEERFRVAQELSPDGFTIFRPVRDAAGNIVDFTWVYENDAIARMNGTDPTAVIGKNLLALFPGHQGSKFFEMYVRTAVTGETSLFEEMYQGETITNPIWFRIVAVRMNGDIAILAQDITERKQAEEALVRHADDLTRLRSDLETTNREANLYLDILTHDIRNTENVSNLYAELLADTLDGEAAGYMEKLRRSINKSIEILSTVSTIRRIHRTSSGLKPIDLDAAIRGVIEEFPGSTIRYDRAHASVLADDLLSVIFNNLIGNAVKFGGPGAGIAVRVKEQDGKVLVSVEDTGPGVPDADKDAIFHRYEQKKRGVGEGLGLYLVQILVERYGGRVWVEDRVPGSPGKGAMFRFTLRKAP